MGKNYIKGDIVSDRKDQKGNWVCSFNTTTNESYIQHYTTSGKLWSQMKARCSQSYRWSVEKPTYRTCENRFRDFQEFAEWCNSTPGYLLDEGGIRWALDKDILFLGNKVYSPKTCAFVPHYINGLFVCCEKKTVLPLGVNYRERFGKYVSQINILGKRTHLGHFNSPIEAHQTWQVAKIDCIRACIDNYSQSSGCRCDVIAALNSRIKIIYEDLQNNQETIKL